MDASWVERLWSDNPRTRRGFPEAALGLAIRRGTRARKVGAGWWREGILRYGAVETRS